MRATALTESYAHCRELVRHADKDRFLATLFAPAERRDHLYALYAFNIEVAKVHEKVSDALPGEVRLQWWCETLAGCGYGEVGRHPVAAALLETLERYALSAEPLIDLVEARTFDLYDEPMATLADLERYAASTSSVPMAAAARILGGDGGSPVQRMARHGGIAYAITGLLRALPFDAARGKVYVPEEVLARHGVAPQDLVIGRRSVALDAALAEMRRVVRDHLQVAATCTAELPGGVSPAFLPVALVAPQLDRMESRRYEPFADCALPQWRRQWILWRAARRARAAG